MPIEQFHVTTILLGVAAFSALIALLYAQVLRRKINKMTVEHERINEISSYIREGAMAYMKRQYRIIAIFAIGVGAILALIGLIPSLQGAEGVGWRSSITFIVGASFSGLAGFIGMLAATKSNARTTDNARKHGMPEALRVAFTGGSVLGLTVVGLGLFGLIALFYTFYVVYGGWNNNDPAQQFQALSHAIHIVTGYGLGASMIALFGRVGGGIYTKAADVGADLVGKVEAGIPEDDPRNPAVIADNVGDNVGDIAGMGSDLTESYVGSIISALTLGLYAFVVAVPTAADFNAVIGTVIFPLVISGLGALSAVFAVFLVRAKHWGHPQWALNLSTYFAVGFMLIGSFVLSLLFFKGHAEASWIGIWLAIVIGLLVGIGLGLIAEYYTSGAHKHVKEIVVQSRTGSATNIIAGFSVGMQSTLLTVLLLSLGIVLSYLFVGDMYGIALASVGMLSTAGITIAVDAYGPIADNAGGIAEMSKLDSSVRNITDHLDAVGNTTAAIGKGFCIGSAALTSIGLFFAFEKASGITEIDILQPGTVIGIFIGAMLPFLFTSLVIKSVGKAANAMIEEVRDQYKNDPGIMKGESIPNYAKCVDISTKAALREMVLPALIAILSPIIAGILIGVQGLGGMLMGGLVSAIMLAVFMANSGGAWDNAKKLVEEGQEGGKGSEVHKATVTGDTVGDPFKDTAGPSMDILIKLMSIVSLILVPILVEIEPLLNFLFSR